MEKEWFMVAMEYSPSEKGIMSSMGYTLMVYSPNGIYDFMKDFLLTW